MSTLRFVFALTCPTLAVISPVVGHRAGIPLIWQVILLSLLMVVGFAVSKSNQPLCEGRTKKGERCKHPVAVGDKFCVQHVTGFWATLRAIPRTRTRAYWFSFVGSNAISVILTIAFYIAGLPPKPLMAAPGPPTGLTATVAAE